MKVLKNILPIFILLSAYIANAQVETLTLSNSIEKVLESNYGIIISKASVEISEINNNWGTAGRYPSVGFNASSANSMELIDNSTTTRISGGIGLTWTIFNGFNVNITKDKLEKLEQLAKGQSGVIVENTIQDIILGYYNILLQQKRQEVLNTLMKLSKDRYNYEQTKYEIGGSVTYNVLLAKNIYLDDKASYLNQEVVVRNAVRNLNFLLGEQPEKQWVFTEEFNSDTSEYLLADLMDKMMASNQTLQNQYVNLLLQQEEIKLKRSSWYPKLSVSAGIDNSYSNTKPDNQPDMYNEDLSPYGNVSLSYDIFSAGNRKRAIDIARINEGISQVETEEMKHSLTNQLFNEYEVYNLRKVLLNVASESLEAAELSLQIAEEKFKTGVINSFNYRDIQLNYLNSALNQLQSIYNLNYSNSTLTRLTGGFLNQP